MIFEQKHKKAAARGEGEHKTRFGTDSIWFVLSYCLHGIAVVALASQVENPTALTYLAVAAIMFAPMILPAAQFYEQQRMKVGRAGKPA